MTEAELMKRRVMTRNGNYFTRFSIKAILQNPVYMIADQESYEFFIEKEADLFLDRAAFDGKHGIMAYNRTDQEKGKTEVEKKIEGLVDSLIDLGDSAAKVRVAKRIEALTAESDALEVRIQELIALTSQHAMSDMEFDVLRQLLSVFKENIDGMPLEQKRAAIRTVVRKVIWDGVNAHVVLFGASEDEIEFPDMAPFLEDADAEDETESLEPFADVDYGEDLEEEGPEKGESPNAPKTHWGEDSK